MLISICTQIYKRAKETGTPSNRKRTGRPVTFTNADKQELIAFVTRDRRTRRLSWEEIVAEMGYACSPQTVMRVMESMGYHKRMARKEPNMCPSNRALRVQWAREHLSWTHEEWKRVLWTDQTPLSTAGFGHRPSGCRWVIRKPGEEDHPDCVDDAPDRLEGQPSRIVWAAFCESIKSEPVYIPKAATRKLDAATYVEAVMEPHLVPLWHRCCEEYGWVKVVEGGAPGTTYSRLNEVDVLDLPAQSPDLNLAGALWKDVETELGQVWGEVSDFELLEAAVRAAWESISEERLDGLIRSMPARLQAVIDADGSPVPY